jgi:YgiT-type zinc finger domain-containing protein
MKECPGKMEVRKITHTFLRKGKPFVVEKIPVHTCSICGYTVLDLQILDQLFAFDPEKSQPAAQAPVYRLRQTALAA